MEECSGFSAPAEDEALAKEVFARLGDAPDFRILHMARLQGFTNRVYAVDTPTAPFCLRIPGAGTAQVIDREREAANARSAAAAGLAPDVLYFDADGVMVTPFVFPARALTPTVLREDSGALLRAAAALRRLHDTAKPFGNLFDAFSTVDRYAALLRSAGGQHPGLHEAISQAQGLRQALASQPVPLRPCHCDTTGANMLDTGERVWLIDWEYSGLNDPMWDLGYLSLQADFDRRLDDALLAAYLGRPALAKEAGRMAVQKAACELLSAAWGLVQVNSGNQVADFRTYAEATLQQFQERMRSAELMDALTELRQG